MCSVDECQKPILARGLCSKHYTRWKTHGTTDKTIKYPPNEIRVLETHCEMDMYDGDGQVIDVCYFDHQDLLLVEGKRWSLAGGAENHRYAMYQPYDPTTQRTKKIYMHRLFMEPSNGMEVDHINHVKLDNRRSNLRNVTRAQNFYNRASRRTSNKELPKGVHKIHGKFYAIIQVPFDTLEEAVEQRLKWEQEFQGEYAYDPELVKRAGWTL